MGENACSNLRNAQKQMQRDSMDGNKNREVGNNQYHLLKAMLAFQRLTSLELVILKDLNHFINERQGGYLPSIDLAV